MKRIVIHTLFLFLVLPLLAQTGVMPGDEQPEAYLPLLQGKRTALFSNHTGMVGERHILDILLEKGVKVVTLFSPEHGFRGKADAGEKVGNARDKKSGLPIISLYGGKNRLNADVMNKFDLLVVDIQDVGLRFYTYYITMYKLMDACARYNKKVVILDRPNPNGHYVDGPVLNMRYRSGVGILPIPVVHGMTLGELARMINGEQWLPHGRRCRLTVIPVKNYTHQTFYELRQPPSPNLPNMCAVYLYPSLCLFEGTVVSLGRGTEKPFQIYGHPDMKGYAYSFTPKSVPGAKYPPLLGRKCYGKDLSGLPADSLRHIGFSLDYLTDAYNNLKMGDRFFSSFFELLTGTDYVRRMIEEGKSADEIREVWRPDVEKFKKQRRPYLLYPEY